MGNVGAFNKSAKDALSALCGVANKSLSTTAEQALAQIQETEKTAEGRSKAPFDSDAPPTAKDLIDLYYRGKFDSEEHRLAYLETCLKYLAGILVSEDIQAFPWPTTLAPSSGQSDSSLIGDFEPVGMLSHFGYRVGKGGVADSKRRKILERVFTENTLPRLNSAAYVQEWGRADTAKRLRKMAESVAAFCRNAKRRSSADMEDSVQDWDTDLAWLKKRFYDGHFNFNWPNTGKEL